VKAIAKTKQAILAHHFWGTYHCQIALEFEDVILAEAACKVLNGHLPTTDKFPMWALGEKHKHVLIWAGNSEELSACKKALVSYGAEEDKIDSIRKSVDCGEPFGISVPVELSDPNQLVMF
jgi:hypothetical protein